MNLDALLKLIEDAFRILPDAESTFKTLKMILAELQAGKMPQITPADLVQLQKDMNDVVQLVADVKKVIA